MTKKRLPLYKPLPSVGLSLVSRKHNSLCFVSPFPHNSTFTTLCQDLVLLSSFKFLSDWSPSLPSPRISSKPRHGDLDSLGSKFRLFTT